MTKIQRIIDSALTIIERNYKADPPARRDVHAKHHGCPWAYFVVQDGIAPALRHGIFAQPSTHAAWVRFSNSEGRVKSDDERDGRGLAIKLLEVEGERAALPANTDPQPRTQDFVLLNHSAFFARDLEEMARIFEWLAAGRALPLYFLRYLRLRGLWVIFKLATRPQSPLELTYFSQTPFQLGPVEAGTIVKYRVRPDPPPPKTRASASERASGDHLRHVLRRQLQPSDIDRQQAQEAFAVAGPRDNDRVFAFELQQKQANDQIDVGNVSWTGPWQKVAELRIPRQDFDAPERMDFGQCIAFSVWNALAAHAPVGELNRARGQVYTATARRRNELNGVPQPAYTIAEWNEKRRVPPGPPRRTVQLEAVLTKLKPRWFGLPATILGSRFSGWIPLLLLALLLTGAYRSEDMGKPINVNAPLQALGLRMPSEDAIPPAPISDEYRKRLKAKGKPESTRPETDSTDLVGMFRYSPLGAEFSAGIPYWIFRVLPAVCPAAFEDGDWGRFGLDSPDDKDYYDSYHGLPRGLVLSDTVVRLGNHDFELKLKRVALNCSSCHRGEYLDAEGKAKFVDGMPNLRFDAAAYKRQTVAAMRCDGFSAERVTAEIDRALVLDHTLAHRAGSPPRLNAFERTVYGFIVNKMRGAAEDHDLHWIDERAPNGPGRLDAFGALRYEHLKLSATPAQGMYVATVDLPSIWNGRNRPAHHYDGNTTDLRARNMGAIAGIGGSPLSIRVEKLQQLSQWIDHGLRAPRFPFPLDAARVQHGKGIYDRQCASCHGNYDGNGSVVGASPRCMTDPTHTIDVGTDSKRAEAVESEFVDRLNQLGERTGLWSRDAFHPAQGYLCPPLDGIWARAPYLHNGSVPTLFDLLRPVAERPADFVRGNPEYDRERGGFVTSAPKLRSAFRLDTTLEGNSNVGHSGPLQIVADDQERRDLVAYLLSL